MVKTFASEHERRCTTSTGNVTIPGDIIGTLMPCALGWSGKPLGGLHFGIDYPANGILKTRGVAPFDRKHKGRKPCAVRTDVSAVSFVPSGNFHGNGKQADLAHLSSPHSAIPHHAVSSMDPSRKWSVHRSSRADVDLRGARGAIPVPRRSQSRIANLGAVRSTLSIGRMQRQK